MSDSVIAVLKTIFDRDLTKLKTEIDAYSKEENLWIATKDISNSAGNLCLHLIGNLKTYLGAEFGKTGYIRERDKEFSLKNVPRTQLISIIDDVLTIVQDALDKITDDDLQKEYPRILMDKNPSTLRFLIHLTTHLTYHLGQINYHRRILDV
ncbi:DinB family protein [Aquimarina sp. SS2-1]|uniref:DinB family protein n=1 Tax=Aquimarina besae TaxID=3342247 RepID=UPI00366FDFFE